MDSLPNRSVSESCALVRASAREAILSAQGKGLPESAEAHLAACPDCRLEVDEITRIDRILQEAFRRARQKIPNPSPEAIDSILSAIRSEPPSAALLRRIRRSVNRMLWLTLLVLSFLLICGIGWAVLKYLKLLQGG